MNIDVEENLEFQKDELNTLIAIYGDDFVVDDDVGSSRVCFINLRNNDSNPVVEIKLQLTVPRDYPSRSPPMFELNCPHMNAADKRDISSILQNIYLQNINQPVLYLWIEAVKTKLTEFVVDSNENKSNLEASIDVDETNLACFSTNSSELPEIFSGTPLTDRKSTFQAHVASPIVSKDQVKEILKKLKENSKIGKATHNIYAFRINDGRSTIADCEDDGEHQAGSRLSHLLTMMDANNVLVVVSRWYGGIHLSTDRFKHINNVARTLLEERGFGPKPKPPDVKGNKRQNKK